MPLRRIVLLEAPAKEADKLDKAQVMADAMSRLVEQQAIAEGSLSEPEPSASATSNVSSVTNLISGAVGWGATFISGAVGWGNANESGGPRHQTSLPEDCEN